MFILVNLRHFLSSSVNDLSALFELDRSEPARKKLLARIRPYNAIRISSQEIYVSSPQGNNDIQTNFGEGTSTFISDEHHDSQSVRTKRNISSRMYVELLYFYCYDISDDSLEERTTFYPLDGTRKVVSKTARNLESREPTSAARAYDPFEYPADENDDEEKEGTIRAP